MLTAIVTAVVSAGVIFVSLFLLKRQITVSVGAERDTLLEEIPQMLKRLEELVEQTPRFASRLQLETLIKQSQAIELELAQEKENLKSVEARLDEAQKSVELKESAHQELKSAKEDEEIRLQELLERYNQISSESIELEQKLAASMKNLDLLMEEADLTPDQKAAFDQLSKAMTNAGARLRDLMIEYNTVKERLELLKTQHKDLEEEYTRLVEQQLGE